MHRKPTKRKQFIKLVVTYSLMTTTVLALVSVLILVTLGYSFNQKDNKIEQGGLLQFASKPNGAVVTLDEVPLGALTPSKTTASAQSHTIKMNLKGYRTWQKTIDLKPGMIGWLSYARLVPTEPQTEKLRSFVTLAASLPSPNNKFIALIEDASIPSFVVADVQSDETKYEILTLPAGTFTEPTDGAEQRFTLESWSNDANRLIIKHVYDTDKIEWLVADIDDITKTKNITSSFGLAADKVVFGPRNGQTLFAKNSGQVYRIELDDQVLGSPIATNIEDFSIYDSTVMLYTTLADPVTGQRAAGYMAEGMRAAQPLGVYPADGQSLKIAMGEYFGKRYVAIGHGASVVVTEGDLPRPGNKGTMKSVAAMRLPAPVEWLSMSTNSRFVIAQAAGTYTTSDLELLKTDTTTLKDVTVSKQLRWLDDYLTSSDAGGMLRLYEFDGANQQNLVPVAEGFAASLGPNDKYIYCIARDGEGFTLQRVNMVVK